MSLTLRRWQAEAIPLALAALEAAEPALVVATTGAGKSIFLAELLRRWRETHPVAEGVVVVSTPSKKLVEQLAGTLGAVLGPAVVGRYYTQAKQDRREVIVVCNASVEMLAARLQEAGRTVAVWIADEAHKTHSLELVDEENASAEVGERLNAVRRLGLTATPFRSDEGERLALFDRVIYRYPPAEALRDGVIVPWRFVGWEGDEVEVDTACVEMIRALGDRVTRGPGVVNAKDIEDAEAYCGTLSAAGITARPIHSKLGRGEQEAAVEALRRGDIDCLVHVSMLVEGVDLPWLRWGCFRRQVGARVRFIQELGRFLRANPEDPAKTEAVLLDPHNLSGTFNVSYSEALGWSDPKGTGAPRDEYDADEMDEDAAESRVVKARRVGALSRYVRQLHLALIAEGVCQAPSTIKAGGWREDPASEKQSGALAKMVRTAARLGPEHREALGRIVDTPGVLTKGLASDAFDLLAGVRNLPGGRVWRPAVPVGVPPGVAFEVVVDPVVYVAGVMKGDLVAIGIVQGGRTLYASARPRRQGDRWVALTSSAMWAAVRKFGAREVGSSEPDIVAEVPEGVVGRSVKREENPAARVAWRALDEAAKEAARRAADPQVPLAVGS